MASGSHVAIMPNAKLSVEKLRQRKKRRTIGKGPWDHRGRGEALMRPITDHVPLGVVDHFGARFAAP